MQVIVDEFTILFPNKSDVGDKDWVTVILPVPLGQLHVTLNIPFANHEVIRHYLSDEKDVRTLLTHNKPWANLHYEIW